VGLTGRAAGRSAASTPRPGAGVERSCRGDMGCSGASRPCKLASASRTDPTRGPNLGSATAPARVGATAPASEFATRPAAGSGKLGRHSGSPRANVGRPAARGAAATAATRTGCSAAAPGASSRRATATGSGRARAHVGIAAG
jgi:hypothetical protein